MMPSAMTANSAQLALQGLTALRDKAASHLAQACRQGSEISNDLIDEHQLAAFDLSYLSAQISSAQAMMDFSSAQGQLLEQKLTEFFIADTVSEVTGKFGSRLREFGCDTEFMLKSLWNPEVMTWVGEILSPKNFTQIGQLLLEKSPAQGLSPEHEDIRQLFKKFGETKIWPIAEKIHREDAITPESVIEELASMGCFGLSIPQRFDGFQDNDNPDNLAMVLATEELSRCSLGAAGSLVTRPEILAKAILKGGTPEQQQKWLPVIARGEKMVSVAVTEPDYGSDVAGIIVKATPQDDGWVINGAKMWCTFGGRADILMVLARTDPDRSKKHRGLSILIAEKPPFLTRVFEYQNPKGGSISGRQIACIGYRGMHTYEVVFNNYWVPKENLIGGDAGLGKGFYLQMEGFAGGRLQTAARANGVSQACFEEAVKYASSRKVFGKTVSQYQLTLWKLVRMSALLTASRQLSYRVAKLFDQGQGAMEASLVKLFASRIAEWIARESVQIHGAMGYAEETAVSRYFADARVFSIFEGAEEILALRVIARSLLENAKGK